MAEWSTRVQNALAALPRPPSSAGALEVAALTQSEWSLLVYCYLNEPPFTLDELRVWLPYTSEALFGRWFKELLATLNVQRVASGDFIVTDKGAALVNEWYRNGTALLAHQHPLAQTTLMKHADGLELVVRAALERPPVRIVRLSSSRRMACEPQASAMVRIDQALTDLHYFRDDCHTAAWNACGLSGPEIELLTVLWRQGAKDVGTLVAQLGDTRGHEPEQVARIAQRLASRGWLALDDDNAELTVAGKGMRDEIEAATNRNYMPPWTVLPPRQLQELGRLMCRFTQSLPGSR